MTTLETGLRLGAGLGLGMVIGIERQWRARGAGLRTNALVSTGAALFVLLSAYGFDTGLVGGVRVADPTRVAAQIVSGIGFLGAGVILRDGLNVRGLNTAATLWCAAAVGALAGAGMYQIAVLGTTAVIIANVVLRPLGRGIDRQPTGGDEITVGYFFEAVCAESAEAHIRALLVQAISGSKFALRGIRSYNTDTDHQVSVVAELTAERRDDSQLEQAVSRLSLEPAVTAVTWTVRTDPDNASTDDPVNGATATKTGGSAYRSPASTPSSLLEREPSGTGAFWDASSGGWSHWASLLPC
jgi:putative Mg2+ transporter-C (MgtC) family protein